MMHTTLFTSGSREVAEREQGRRIKIDEIIDSSSSRRLRWVCLGVDAIDDDPGVAQDAVIGRCVDMFSTKNAGGAEPTDSELCLNNGDEWSV